MSKPRTQTRIILTQSSPRRLAAGIVLAAGLAGCQAAPPSAGLDPAEAQPRATIRSQGLIIINPWHSIGPAETRLSIVGDDPVKERRVQQDPHSYAEAMTIERGQLLFERRRQAPGDDAPVTADELLRRQGTAKAVRAAGLTLDHSMVKSRALDAGRLDYLVLDVADSVCGYFLLAPPAHAAERQLVTGSLCGRHGTPDSLRVEHDLLDLAGRLRFDGGRATRARLFAILNGTPPAQGQ